MSTVKSKYTSIQYTFEQLKGKVKVPTFQRRLVWSNTQKHEFIETLSMGYPFGSVLIYNYENNDGIMLIDGLQRFSTIIDYEKHPENFISTDEFVDRLFEILSKRFSDSESGDMKFANSIRKQLINYVKDTLASIDPKSSLLYKKVSNDEILKPFWDSSMIEDVIDLQDEIEIAKKNFLKVDQILIPTIQFLGDVSELAKVFENINKGGKKLTKYQVFAAQWYNNSIQLNDKKYNKIILDEVISRYQELDQNREIKIENFSADQMREEKVINLSELCYALGKLIIKNTPVFYLEKNSIQIEDLADELGYSTMGIIFGVDNKRLHTLQNYITTINNAEFIEELFEEVLTVFININDHFEKYLQLPKQKKQYENKKITNFKFLSYFADLWTKNFKITNEGRVSNHSTGINNKYAKTLSNCIYYYIYDSMQNTWGNAGDSRLNLYYLDKKTYAIRPTKQDLQDALMLWWNERVSTGNLNFDDLSKLILVVNNNTKDNGLHKGRNHDYEHVIVRNKVKDIYQNLQIPAGTLGNMMFLDSNINRSKKDLNIYNLNSIGENVPNEFIELNHYPSESEIGAIEIDLENFNGQSAIEFIKNRGIILIKELVNNLYA